MHKQRSTDNSMTDGTGPSPVQAIAIASPLMYASGAFVVGRRRS